MRSFQVEAEIFRRFEGMHLVVAVTAELSNSATSADLEGYWRDAWASVSDLGLDDARKHPHIDDWRVRFRELGVSMKRFPTSIEALTRRALKGGALFNINPLVDFYNALSVRHLCPAGAFDLGVLSSPIELRFTVGGEQFQALDADDTVSVAAGEIGYMSGHNVLTRHFMWRQARLALVSAETSDVFMVSEIPAAAGAAVAQRMKADMEEGLQRFFGCGCQSFVMSEGDERIEW